MSIRDQTLNYQLVSLYNALDSAQTEIDFQAKRIVAISEQIKNLSNYSGDATPAEKFFVDNFQQMSSAFSRDLPVPPNRPADTEPETVG